MAQTVEGMNAFAQGLAALNQSIAQNAGVIASIHRTRTEARTAAEDRKTRKDIAQLQSQTSKFVATTGAAARTGAAKISAAASLHATDTQADIAKKQLRFERFKMRMNNLQDIGQKFLDLRELQIRKQNADVSQGHLELERQKVQQSDAQIAAAQSFNEIQLAIDQGPQAVSSLVESYNMRAAQAAQGGNKFMERVNNNSAAMALAVSQNPLLGMPDGVVRNWLMSKHTLDALRARGNFNPGFLEGAENILAMQTSQMADLGVDAKITQLRSVLDTLTKSVGMLPLTASGEQSEVFLGGQASLTAMAKTIRQELEQAIKLKADLALKGERKETPSGAVNPSTGNTTKQSETEVRKEDLTPNTRAGKFRQAAIEALETEQRVVETADTKIQEWLLDPRNKQAFRTARRQMQTDALTGASMGVRRVPEFDDIQVLLHTASVPESLKQLARMSRAVQKAADKAGLDADAAERDEREAREFTTSRR